MPKLSFKLSPFFLQALLDVVEPIDERLKLQLAVSMQGAPDDDEDLLDAWRDSLLEQLREDAEYLLQLLHGIEPETELRMSEQEAESALRAASAIRLKIREAFLRHVPEDALERGLVDLNVLGPDEQKPYLCYNFLAHFQEVLLTQLMPEFNDFEEDEFFNEEDED